MAMGGGGASEEALKRSTDCVYFLASPLTCKKVRSLVFLMVLGFSVVFFVLFDAFLDWICFVWSWIGLGAGFLGL